MASHTTHDASLGWPECLGTFDEEACRFFLRQLGQRVVRFYPFSVGIEEVYAQIVDEYGLDDAPDALSVLQELLEDDGTAAGAGDDGDIWRSWRHSWRHRDDNRQNPYIPRVRGQFLRPPTSTRIRLLKSANFAAHQLGDVKSNGARADIISCQSTIASGHEHASVPSHVSRYRFSSDDVPRRHSANASADGSQLLAQECADDKSLLVNHDRSPTGFGELNRSPRRSMPTIHRNTGFPFILRSPKCRSNTLSYQSDAVAIQGIDVILEESDECRSKAPSPCRTPDAGRFWFNSDVGTKTPPSTCAPGGKDNRYSLPSEFGSVDHDLTPSRRRAAHRQVRMIDGALFAGKSRKDNFIGSDDTGIDSSVKTKNDTNTTRLNGRMTQSSSRESWLRNVLGRFRGEHQRKSRQPKLRKKHSSLTSCGIGGKLEFRNDPTHDVDASPPTEMKRAASSAMFGFDGVFDDRRNKPLPLSPAEQHRPSIQSDIQHNFFARGQAPVLLSPDASSASTSHKFTFHKESNLSHLVSATMTGPHELSPKEKAWANRCSSSSSRSGPPSPSSFATFANKNPYHDSSEPSTPTVSAPPPLVCHKKKISSDEWPFRVPQDRERQPDGTGVNRNGRNGDGKSGHGYHDDATTTPQEGHSKHRSGMERGREPATPIRQASPSHLSPNGITSKTPPPRSRSPVKRLIGMVKSMSTNQIQENSTPSKKDTPTSTNKPKWKELSNKLRHGFLTADLEQLEQEQLMEQYSTHDEVQILTPPPSRQRAKCAVSIESSGQSKLWSELEYMLIESCNTFLKQELDNNRLSRDSIIRAKRQWQARNRPQIIEFYYDQATQYDIVIANLRTIKLYSDYAEDAIMLNSVLHQWKILIRELSVKTLCMPDSILRRWLHDSRRVLELLGAPQITLAHLDRLSGLCFAVFGSAEKQRAKPRSTADTASSHRRSVSDGSQNTLWIHEQALMNSGVEGVSQVPPLPTARSAGSATRKVTPQEQRSAQQLRKSMDRERSMFTGGNGHSKPPTPANERVRFPFD